MSSHRRLRRLVISFSLAIPVVVWAQSLLLLQDFGSLHNLGEEPGETIIPGSSRVAGEDDELMSTTYIDAANQILVVANVQTVTDPTWLLHELEGAFRSPDASGLDAGVTVVDSGSRRRLDGSLDLRNTTARQVAWLSGSNRIVSVRFELKGANRGNDVPTQIVDAYLALHPSSLPSSVDDSQAHQATWIRDEMRRLLEYTQRNLGYAEVDAESPEFWRREARRLLGRFAAYRERFYHVGSADEFERSADAAELRNLKPDRSAIDAVKQQAWLQAKLLEFQNWWAAHQNDPVQFPTATPTPVPPATPTP